MPLFVFHPMPCFFFSSHHSLTPTFGNNKVRVSLSLNHAGGQNVIMCVLWTVTPSPPLPFPFSFPRFFCSLADTISQSVGRSVPTVLPTHLSNVSTLPSFLPSFLCSFLPSLYPIRIPLPNTTSCSFSPLTLTHSLNSHFDSLTCGNS